MELEKEIKVNHEITSLFKILSDPCFIIPKIFPSIKHIECKGDEFKGNGNLSILGEYDFRGRVYVGDSRIKYIYNTTKGNGTLEIEKVNVGIIKLKLEHDNGLSSYFIRFLFSSNLRK
ncbi:hypothetical protein DJ522_08160, partial [Sulfolobus sp. F3]